MDTIPRPSGGRSLAPLIDPASMRKRKKAVKSGQIVKMVEPAIRELRKSGFLLHDIQHYQPKVADGDLLDKDGQPLKMKGGDVYTIALTFIRPPKPDPSP